VEVEAESIGLPFVRAVVRITRTCQSTKKGPEPAKSGVRDFITSLPSSTRAERLLEIIRSHWSIENKNHWKRDAQMSEDSPRQKNSRTAQALGIIRGALLPLIGEPCPKLFARCQRKPMQALRILTAPLKAK
jgi:predicted transposase YbfD/YdcC